MSKTNDNDNATSTNKYIINRYDVQFYDNHYDNVAYKYNNNINMNMIMIMIFIYGYNKIISFTLSI